MRLPLLFALLALAVAGPAQTGIKMPLPGFSQTYSYATAVRGFYFQSPVNFTVKGLRVPDESSRGTQNVALYALAAKPTNYTPKQSELLFYKTGVASSQIIPCNVAIRAGDWFCVFGMCGNATASANSYGAGGYKSSIAGGPSVTLNRLYMNLNLVTSGGIGAMTASDTGSIGRVEVYIDPQTFAKAEDYGIGSSVTPVTGHVALPQSPFSSSLSSATSSRGYYFRVPARIRIKAWQVPDEKLDGKMNVAIYRLTTPPPVYPTTVGLAPVYFHSGAKSGAPHVLTTSLVFKQGEILAVLGSCGPDGGGMIHTSYGASTPWQCRMGPYTVTQNRIIMQANMVTNKGVGSASAHTSGFVGRVLLFTKEQVVPVLTTGVLPAIGSTATLEMESKLKDGIAGGIFMSVGRLNYPLPLGTLLVNAPFFGIFPVPGGTGTYQLPIPNNPSFVGGGPLNFQGFVMTLDNFGLTNGVEWYVGK